MTAPRDTTLDDQIRAEERRLQLRGSARRMWEPDVDYLTRLKNLPTPVRSARSDAFRKKKEWPGAVATSS